MQGQEALVYANFWTDNGRPPLKDFQAVQLVEPYRETFRSIWLLWGDNAVRCLPDPPANHSFFARQRAGKRTGVRDDPLVVERRTIKRRLIRVGDDFPAARDRLRREVERLEVAPKRITNILYPPSLAVCLGVAEVGNPRRKILYAAT